MRRTLAALCLTLLLGACANGRGDYQPPGRDIPSAPAFAKPVEVRDPARGEDMEVVATRERRARQRANRIIGCTVAAWERVRAGVAGDNPKTTCK